MPQAGQGAAQTKLDALGIEWLVDGIGAGKSLAIMSAEAGVSIGALFNWRDADAERSARAREARVAMAQHWDEQAERVIMEAKAESVEIQRARELAQHYRWRASKVNPGAYGDKLNVGGDPNSPLTVVLRRFVEDVPK